MFSALAVPQAAAKTITSRFDIHDRSIRSYVARGCYLKYYARHSSLSNRNRVFIASANTHVPRFKRLLSSVCTRTNNIILKSDLSYFKLRLRHKHECIVKVNYDSCILALPQICKSVPSSEDSESRTARSTHKKKTKWKASPRPVLPKLFSVATPFHNNQLKRDLLPKPTPKTGRGKFNKVKKINEK